MWRKKEALQELLKILSDTPEIADKVVITIKPNSKPQQGTGNQDKALKTIVLITALLNLIRAVVDIIVRLLRWGKGGALAGTE